jgi:hypothetical protein
LLLTALLAYRVAAWLIPKSQPKKLPLVVREIKTSGR